MKRMLILFGTIVIVLAVIAPQIGLDNDAGWGRGRTALLVAGIVFLLTGTVLHFVGATLSRWWGGGKGAIDRRIGRQGWITVALISALVSVLATYIWIIQLERRDAFTEYNYYIELARGFKNGHLYIEEKPSTALLSLGNPYDYFLRKEKNVEDFPWDVSLYKGKFYIYWGPVPAVLVMFVSRTWLARIGDFHLALAFACGLYIYLALLLSRFWRRSLIGAPAWLLYFLLLVVGFATPSTIMLKGAKIYEAAIFGCQFFFIGGCYWCYRSISKENLDVWLLALASFHWALAVGTRVIILPAVVFAAGFTLIYIYIKAARKTKKHFVLPFFAVSLPLMGVGLGLAVYNFARFENILEFGLTYQLANIDYTNFQNVFSPSHVRQNLYVYFLYPVRLLSRFPFIHRMEYLNSNDRMAGLLFVAPFFILALPLVWLKKYCGGRSLHSTLASGDSAGNWLYALLAGSGTISFIIIMSYYFVAMRFIQDFIPSLLAYAVLQVGWGYDAGHGRAFFRTGLLFVIVLGCITIITNILLAVPDSGILFAVNLINAINKLLGLR